MRPCRLRLIRILTLTLRLSMIMLPAATASGGDYDFAIPEARAQLHDLRARAELRFIYHRFDEDAAFYKTRYYADAPGSAALEGSGSLELTGALRQGMLQAHLLSRHAYAQGVQEDRWINELYEGYVAVSPTAHLTLAAGKRSIVWGTGYAWNPAAFLNRPKDPDDPALSLEGRTLLGLDLIKSFTGRKVANIGFTALLLPVIDSWANGELGDAGDLCGAFKLYMLWRDTDLDFIFFDGPQQPRGYGFDFATNLAPHIAVHGELAFRQDAARPVLDRQGNVVLTHEDQLSYLLGIRYLTAHGTTCIAEYYHNGAGYGRDALRDFFAYQGSAFRQFQATGDTAIMQRADGITRPYYQQRHFGRDYVYLRISRKEPFDILYFTPWMAAMVNLQDWSWNLQAGLTWTPISNWELNTRIGIPMGPSGSDFGERQNRIRPEIWIRYYF
jgi:hypothetical protein